MHHDSLLTLALHKSITYLLKV